ncbi:MAG: ribbon-helix-helix domain-containing protein [Nitrospirota bacterium]
MRSVLARLSGDAMMSCHQVIVKGNMPNDARTTVYLKPKVYRALKVKAAETDRTISELVNEAVIELLREDAEDLEAFEKRRKEPSRPFEKALEDLKRDGLL